VSPSTITIRSNRAACSPVLSAIGLPGVRLPDHSYAGDMQGFDQVRRTVVEPSSTTITSSGWSDATSDRMATSMPAAFVVGRDDHADRLRHRRSPALAAHSPA